MDIFSVFTLLGGLALFLYGMNTMGDGLEKLSGGKLEKTLEKMTSNIFKAVFLGLGVTMVIQSSSATTVMVVGFVNSGIMKLEQAIGIIMGANVGTTITAWILSLTGIQGDSFFINMLKPSSFSPILAFIAIVILMFVKRGKSRDVAVIFMGFAMLMFGMDMMSSSVQGLKDVPEFTSVLTMFSDNPILGVLAGALITGIIQSSSASVGILQALSLNGAITYSAAIPIIMGQNIGTCVTALLSCIGAKKNAKRAAFVHLYFNIIGTVVLMTAYYILNAIFNFAFADEVIGPAGIAIVHSTFNILCTVMLLPFSKLLGKLACLTIRDKDTDDGTPFIDERFLNTPPIAVEQCRAMTVKMAEKAKNGLIKAMGLVDKYDDKVAQEIIDAENDVDVYEDVIGSYLVKLSSKDLSLKDSNEISALLHLIGDFERISDHAINVQEVAQELHEKKVTFSDQAKEELAVMNAALKEILEKAITAFEQDDLVMAELVEPLEEVIDGLRDKLKARHIKRLQDGTCTIELGFILTDLLTNYERVSDHCSNIAVCLIQERLESFDTHEYLHDVKSKEDSAFVDEYKRYKAKYRLPA